MITPTAVSPRRDQRLTWATRELTVPWELRDADIVCTPLGTLLPLAARARRAPRTVVLNVNFCTALERLDGARRRHQVSTRTWCSPTTTRSTATA